MTGEKFFMYKTTLDKMEKSLQVIKKNRKKGKEKASLKIIIRELKNILAEDNRYKGDKR